MSLKIASWNIEGRLSEKGNVKRGTDKHIIESIKKLDADILVLLEAHSENSIDEVESKQQLVDMGYNIHSVTYDDDGLKLRADSYASQLSLMILSKFPIDHIEIVSLGGIRNSLIATIQFETNKIFRIIGVHLDDRSETTRVKQIKDLTKIVNQSDIPTIVMGDFNAMHSSDFWPARMLRSYIAKLLSNFILPGISSRAIEMARGDCLKFLQSNTNLSDADPKHRPTSTPKMRGFEWLPSIRLIQIDHIFISKNIAINNFQIAQDGGSDHRAVSAEISIK